MKISPLATLLLASFCALGSTSWSYAGTTESEPSRPNTLSPTMEKAQQAREEAQEIRAHAEKIEAETKLQEVLLWQKMSEQIAKVKLEGALAKEATHKAETEAKQAEASAATAEAMLRVMKAKAEMHVLEQNWSTTFWEAKVAAAKAEKAESELKIAKMQLEKDKLGKPQ